MRALRQRQSAQAPRALRVDDRQGPPVVEAVHLQRAEVLLGHLHAIAGLVCGPLVGAVAPRGLLVDVGRFLEQFGIDAGDPVGAGEAERRLLVVAADADQDVLLLERARVTRGEKRRDRVKSEIVSAMSFCRTPWPQPGQ